MTSSQTEKGPRSSVIFDAFDTRNVLGRQPPGMTFVLALHKSREMNDAILHDDILAEQMRPAPPFNLGKKPLANGTVISSYRCSNIGRRQSLQHVAACHNADETSILDDQHAFDTVPIQNVCTFSDRGRRSYSDHRSG